MKLLILGDTHFGCRNDNEVFYYHFEKFYNMMFQYCIDNKIDTIFQLGDLFDKRKQINFKTLEYSKRAFFNRFEENNIQLYAITGNHDIFYRESTKLNSSILINSDFVKVFNEPYTVYIDNTSIDMIPWICKDNQEDIKKFISESKSDLCFGHLELNGFPMYKGVVAETGKSDGNIFSKYELVCTGHYHTKSCNGNITYVGTPYEMTWMDYNDPKGFHIFDTITRELSFIPNPHTAFQVIEYDDTKENITPYDVVNKFIKIIVKNKNDAYTFDRFLDGLTKNGVYDIKVLEGDIISIIESEETETPPSTLEIINRYVDNSNITEKDDVKDFLKSLYIETLNGVE